MFLYGCTLFYEECLLRKKPYVQYYSKLSRETGKCFQEKPGEGEIVKNLEIS